jgi:hypothetical protein
MVQGLWVSPLAIKMLDEIITTLYHRVFWFNSPCGLFFALFCTYDEYFHSIHTKSSRDGNFIKFNFALPETIVVPQPELQLQHEDQIQVVK